MISDERGKATNKEIGRIQQQDFSMGRNNHMTHIDTYPCYWN